MAEAPQRGSGETHVAGEKRGIRAFLTPGWILSLAFVLLFMFFAFNTLAPWQLGKNTKRSEFNERLSAAMEEDPVPLSGVLPEEPGKPVGEEEEWRHVSMQGKFLPHEEVLLRNRPVESSPAYQVLTPFETEEGLTVVVNRGWIPAEGGENRPDNIAEAPSGTVELTGFVRLGESASDQGVIQAEGREQTGSINAEQIAESTGLTLAHDYVQLDESSTETVAEEITGNGEKPHAIPLPKIDSGPYLSYGIQWIAFGIIAPILLGWFIWSEIKERRREQLEEQQLAGSSPISPAPTQADSVAETPAGGVLKKEEKEAATPKPEQPEQPAQSQQDALAARYGKAAKRRGFGWGAANDGERF